MRCRLCDGPLPARRPGSRGPVPSICPECELKLATRRTCIECGVPVERKGNHGPYPKYGDCERCRALQRPVTTRMRWCVDCGAPFEAPKGSRRQRPPWCTKVPAQDWWQTARDILDAGGSQAAAARAAGVSPQRLSVVLKKKIAEGSYTR